MLCFFVSNPDIFEEVQGGQHINLPILGGISLLLFCPLLNYIHPPLFVSPLPLLSTVIFLLFLFIKTANNKTVLQRHRRATPHTGQINNKAATDNLPRQTQPLTMMTPSTEQQQQQQPTTNKNSTIENNKQQEATQWRHIVCSYSFVHLLGGWGIRPAPATPLPTNISPKFRLCAKQSEIHERTPQSKRQVLPQKLLICLKQTTMTRPHPQKSEWMSHARILSLICLPTQLALINQWMCINTNITFETGCRPKWLQTRLEPTSWPKLSLFL